MRILRNINDPSSYDWVVIDVEDRSEIHNFIWADDKKNELLCYMMNEADESPLFGYNKEGEFQLITKKFKRKIIIVKKDEFMTRHSEFVDYGDFFDAFEFIEDDDDEISTDS